MRTDKSDIYGEITNQIIEAIEAGADKYQMPWHVNGAVIRVKYFSIRGQLFFPMESSEQG